MTVKELIDTLESSDRLRIIKDGADVLRRVSGGVQTVCRP